MALAALFFPEARTLALQEGDPFLLGTAASLHAQQAHTCAAYDPAFVVPAAVALLRRGCMTAECAVRTGWVPLLLRCLASRDAALRYAPGPVRL